MQINVLIYVYISSPMKSQHKTRHIAPTSIRTSPQRPSVHCLHSSKIDAWKFNLTHSKRISSKWSFSVSWYGGAYSEHQAARTGGTKQHKYCNGSLFQLRILITRHEKSRAGTRF